MLSILLIWCWNLFISFANAYGVGISWVETRAFGGWRHFMNWMGAIMAAIGFTWCALLPLGYAAHDLELLSDSGTEAFFSLGYLLILPELLLCGIIITIDSWAQAFRSGKLRDYAVAAYNSYADYYNFYHAFSDGGEAWKSVVEFFFKTAGLSPEKSSSSSSDNENGNEKLIVIVLIVMAISIGVITTWVIIRRYAGSRAFDPSIRAYQKSMAR